DSHFSYRIAINSASVSQPLTRSPRAELPCGGEQARGDQATGDAGQGHGEQKRGGGRPADRGEGLGKGRKGRRGLAAAELAAPGLHPEPELDRRGGGGADDDCTRGDRRL